MTLDSTTIMIIIGASILSVLISAAIWSYVFGMPELKKEAKRTNAYLRELAERQGLSMEDADRIDLGYVKKR